jgi:hypothetical protein
MIEAWHALLPTAWALSFLGFPVLGVVVFLVWLAACILTWAVPGEQQASVSFVEDDDVPLTQVVVRS